MSGTKENSGFSGPVGSRASAGQLLLSGQPTTSREEGRGGGVCQGFLHALIIALLSFDSDPFLVQGLLSVKGLEGLDLRCFF